MKFYLIRTHLISSHHIDDKFETIIKKSISRIWESENSGDDQRTFLSRRTQRFNLSIARSFTQKNIIEEEEDEMTTLTSSQFAETLKIKWLNDSEDWIEWNRKLNEHLDMIDL
jgi:uncharacterized membrane-anchored protein